MIIKKKCNRPPVEPIAFNYFLPDINEIAIPTKKNNTIVIYIMPPPILFWPFLPLAWRVACRE